MGHERSSASEGFLRLGHVCSWLTHVLSLPDNEGNAAFALTSAACAGRDVKSKTPSEMVLVLLFCFDLFAFVMGQFCPAQIPGHSAVMPRTQPLPFGKAVLRLR